MMRYFIQDPDNEERLIKIPHRVVSAIRQDMLAEVRSAVSYLPYRSRRVMETLEEIEP